MKEKCAKLWQKLSVALKPQVSADTFKRWFSAVELIDATDNSLTFRVPNNIYQFWIESNHMAALQAAIVTAFGGPREVKFSSPPGTSVQVAEDAAALKEVAQTRLATRNRSAARSGSIHETRSNRLSSVLTTRSRMRPVWRSRSYRPGLITRCLFTAAWALARRTSCRRSANMCGRKRKVRR